MTQSAATRGEDFSLLRYLDLRTPDLLAKCRAFASAVATLGGEVDTLYHVPIEGPLDHRVHVSSSGGAPPRELVCFDSNSYLGLHLHPRVVAATAHAVERLGYGTPSAQVLGGTTRELGELERTLARFHGREAAIVFPSGYAANLGVVTALVGRHDAVFRDRFSHASLHDGVLASRARRRHVFPHRDAATLDRLLAGSDCQGGKLIVTDGVFSMHGSLAGLPELVALRDRHGARLLVDDAHGVGVLGAEGRGIEEHYGLLGAADVLVGTFSKAPGALGGYACGSRELVEYLRFYARAGFFTAALPAALCVGITEAFRVIADEPELRDRLWRNVRYFHAGLAAAGLVVSPPTSPILTVFVGPTSRLWAVGRALFDAGVKSSSVDFPAVPRHEALIRLSVTARHTQADLDLAIEALRRVGARFGILQSQLGRPAAEASAA